MHTIQVAFRLPADIVQRLDRLAEAANAAGGLARATRTSVLVALMERTLPEVEREYALDPLKP